MIGSGDREVARLARAQRGMVLREQLEEAGLGRGKVQHRVRCGRLEPVLPDVFGIGGAAFEKLSLETAAVLHFRGWAVLSHRSAGAIWGLLETPPPRPELSTGKREFHRRQGVVLHRAPLPASEIRLRAGLPVTSPPRTLFDMALDSDDDEFELAAATALERNLASERELARLIETYPHRKGVTRMRRLLKAEAAPPAYTRSGAERRMLALLRSSGLPVPDINVPLLGFVADFFWPDERLVVEIDGFQFHRGRRMFDSDRRRDQVLIAAGYRVIRFTWPQLVHEPLGVIARLAQALVR